MEWFTCRHRFRSLGTENRTGSFSPDTPGTYWHWDTAALSGGISDNGSVRLDLENMPQPDLFLMIQPAHGGQARIDEG